MSPLLVLLILLTPPPQLPPDACTLLKEADLSGFAGPVSPHNSDMTAGGQTVRGCMWQTGKEGMVAISIARGAQDAAGRKAGIDMIEKTYNQLKAKGWTEERKDFAGGRCAALTPPASDKDAPFTTGCFVEVKGLVVSVSSLGTKKVAIDLVKPLLDKLVERLP